MADRLTIDGFAILRIPIKRKTMAQKGDSFNPKSSFGAVVQFDTAETQRTLGFSENTYQGRILKNWSDALGSSPTTSVLTGLRISGFGTPSLAPAAGTANASLLQYVKQVEIDLAGIKVDAAGIKADTAAITTQLATLTASLAAIAASTAVIATSTTASAASSATIAAQQAQIITLLISINNKP